MQITRVGVDTAKQVFHVHAVDRYGCCVWSRKLPRKRWLAELAKRLEPGTIVALEACGASHHWARELRRLGFEPKLIAAQFVKPFVKSNKNDRIDAEAICEAAARPSMRFVSVRSAAQQDLQAVHRIRAERVRRRTALANQIRGLVGEYGIIAPVGIVSLRRAIPRWLEDAENGLSDAFRALLAELREELQTIDERIHSLDERIVRQAAADPVAARLTTLRGVGPLGATALSIALTNPEEFRRGRDFAASIGLVPRQQSTGGRTRLRGISKRGDSYLRQLLVHGARSVIRHARHRDDRLSRWLNTMCTRKHVNVVTVALANKTARMAWALVHDGTVYEPERAAA